MLAERPTNRVSLVAHGVALIVVYSLYGYLQEKIMKKSTYGPESEHFTSSSILIVFNRLFSISAGLVILLYKSRQQPELGAFTNRLKPASPYFAYASVALFNFLSTTCQYQALRYVSYTTQSLAKTSKMVPVLVVGALVWKQKHPAKSWVAAAVILVGCATYLFASPPARLSAHGAVGVTEGQVWLDGAVGACLLLGYLFFDGLVSTTQEKVFGKNPAPSDPFGPESPVLDQMIWTNVFACLIAVLASIASTATGGFWKNFELLLTSSRLLWDVCVFSAASAVGLIILLNTIASFGALTSSLIMTVRQFLSILINAGLFGNFASSTMVGWTGVFWVASGIWIKVNRSYDQPEQLNVVFSNSDESNRMLDEKESQLGNPVFETRTYSPESSDRLKRALKQYIAPCLAAVAAAFVLSPWMGQVIKVEGGAWDVALLEAFQPQCQTKISPIPYQTNTSTGFVSFPRSGNSYLRGLVLRSSGYQTSSVYCDRTLENTLYGECDHKQKFFVKTHFPVVPAYAAEVPAPGQEYWEQYDRVVHLAKPGPNGELNHEAKLDIKIFGEEHRGLLIRMAESWNHHALYWTEAPLQTHTMRYEDLKARPLPNMMSLLSFLLPDEDLPPLQDVACIAEHRENLQAYHSRRSSDFSNWHKIEPVLRTDILKAVRRPFCAFGYRNLLLSVHGDDPAVQKEMDGFCVHAKLKAP
ncbi:hypothetical protein JCM11251_003210 [Rhodosporidiobolus azoricus]